MTQRLYFDDAYRTEFTATVLAQTSADGRPALLLDRTCFYPAAGGQPCDTGVLAGAAVVEVIADGDSVLHVLAEPVAAVAGATVAGAIDWPRRYDHMQQHTGQHLLSQVFTRLFGYETVAVHIGAVDATLDLAADVSSEAVAAAEAEANRLAYTALPVKTYFVDDAAIGTLPVRRPPKVSGLVRIVEIDGYDYSACGGTHLHTTAEAAPLKIVRQERRRGQTRITFKCGLRAWRDYVEKHAMLVTIAGLFSTDIAATPGLVQRAQEQNRELQRQVAALEEQLVLVESVDLWNAAPEVAGRRLVVQHAPDRSVDALKTAAAQLRSHPQTVALLATSSGGKLTVIFARSDDVDLHMGNLLRDALRAFGGGGGGRPEFAQGGGIDPAQAQALLDYARRSLEKEEIERG
jgi:alanyl-tRNA synthetase